MRKNKKPKVLHIITRYILGGAEEDIELQLASLSKNYNLYLAVGKSYDKKRLAQFCFKNNIKYKVINSMRHYNIIMLIFSIFEIKKYIMDNRFDIVHTHTTEAGIVGRFAAKLAKTPIIIHSVQTIPFIRSRFFIANETIVLLEKMVAKFTDKYISIANSLTKAYLDKKIGKKEKYTTIYIPFDKAKINDLKPIKNLSRAKLTVCFIGRISTAKGVIEILQAAKKLKDLNVDFFLVGSGELEAFCEKYIRHYNLSKIKMLGFRKDALNILNTCDILLLPSYAEGTPRVILEAIALKKTVIATNVGGIPEILEKKSGFIIKPRNWHEIANTINYLYNNPKKIDEIKHLKTDILEKFSIKENKTGLNNIYRNLLYRKLKREIK